MGMLNFAHHIIAVANQRNIPITNLQLQKVMYFSLKKAMNEGKFSQKEVENIYDKPFLVWRYGPVVEEVYDEYRIFGADPIIENYKKIDELNVLNDDINSLLKENAFDLVTKSHGESFWKENKSRIDGWRSNIAYTLDDIKKCD